MSDGVDAVCVEGKRDGFQPTREIHKKLSCYH